MPQEGRIVAVEKHAAATRDTARCHALPPPRCHHVTSTLNNGSDAVYRLCARRNAGRALRIRGPPEERRERRCRWRANEKAHARVTPPAFFTMPHAARRYDRQATASRVIATYCLPQHAEPSHASSHFVPICYAIANSFYSAFTTMRQSERLMHLYVCCEEIGIC